jgi:hypothetical protein
MHLFEHPKMQHFLMIYSDLMKKNYEGTKKLCQHRYVKTLFKITPTLKIDLVFKYMLSTKILVPTTGYLDIVLHDLRFQFCFSNETYEKSFIKK